jgi:hypothetical protein
MSSNASLAARSSPLASVRPILFDLWRRHGNQGTRWLGLLLVATCVLMTSLPVVISLISGAKLAPLMVAVCASASGGVLLAVFWILTVGSVLEQNHPVLARTVPGHVRRLRGALLLYVGGCVALVAAATAVILQLAPASATDQAMALMAAVAAAALVLAYIAQAMRWPTLWLAVWIGPAVAGSALADPRASRALASIVAPLSTPAGAAVGMIATLIACAAVVHGLVATGGPRHEQRYAALRARSKRTNRGIDRGLEQFLGDRLLGRLSALRDGLYAAAVRRQLACGGSPAAARAMLAFGPAAHWTAQMGAMVGVLGLVGVLAAVMVRAPDNTQLGGIVTGFSISLMLACSRLALNARAWLHATRGEQSLAMLAPGTPRGGTLNRAIGWRMALQFLTAWAVGLGGVELAQCVLGHTVAFGSLGSFGSWRRLVTMLALSQLLLVATLWRRWDRVPPATRATTFVLVLLPTCAALGGVALTVAGVPTAVAGATIVAVAAALAGWRWARIGAEPSMLPVGRDHR